MSIPVITCIQIDTVPERQEEFVVGARGVTMIEATTKPGMYAEIPYVRVWCGNDLRAEFCQHNIVGIYFAPAVSGSAA